MLKMEKVFLLMISVLLCKVRGSNEMYCDKRNGCKENIGRFVPLCYCDQKCYMYRDCCREMYEVNRKENMTSPTFQPTESCNLLTDEKHLKSKRIGAFMIDRCNGFACKTKTGDLKTLIPVSNGNTTYRNEECALCNNVTKFKNWNIAFTISKRFEKELTGGKIRNKTIILNEIENVDFTGTYYLHPSVGITPRFCPFDVHEREIVVKEQFDYQDVCMCKAKVYKNRDECLEHGEDGCCTASGGFSVQFHLPLYRTTSSQRSGSLPFHLIIKFEETKTGADSRSQEKDLLFNDIKGYVNIELTELDKGRIPLFDCMYGIMVYLKSTIYELVPGALQFLKIKLQGNDSLVFYPFNSMRILSFSEYNDLFEMKIQIQCEYESGDIAAYGQIKTSGINGNKNMLNPNIEQIRMSDTGRFQMTPPGVIGQCDNVTLAIHRSSAWEIPVEVKCLDDEEISVKKKVNRADRLHNNDFIQIFFLCHVILWVTKG